MEDDTSAVRCFACSELSATGAVKSILVDHGEIAVFLQEVGTKVSFVGFL